VPDTPAIAAAAACLGLLAAWLGAEATGLLARPVNERSLSLAAREQRRMQLESRWFALFEHLVAALAQLNVRFRPGKCSQLARADAELAPFSPAEFLALCQIRGLAAGIVVAAAAPLLGTTLRSALVFAVLTAIAVSSFFVRRQLRLALRNQQQIRARLPFAIEMMALLIESGVPTILEAIRMTAAENHGHPLARRFQKLLAAEGRGADLSHALREWAQETADEDFEEFSFALRTSLDRGTPIRDTLRSLAAQFLQRRLQRLERAAEETRVHITWPGMLVVLSCLMIVSAPFILAARDILGW
jgi:Flp pilus assembly protein TadB